MVSKFATFPTTTTAVTAGNVMVAIPILESRSTSCCQSVQAIELQVWSVVKDTQIFRDYQDRFSTNVGTYDCLEHPSAIDPAPTQM